MNHSVLIDNWTLQSAGEFLAQGLEGDTASELQVAEDRTGFSYRARSADVVNASALFQVLNHLVFVDEILVDDGGVATWRDQLGAQRMQRDAARDTARLTDLKASRGAVSALEQLEAQRSLLVAEQAVLQARLGELASRVALYKALGG